MTMTLTPTDRHPGSRMPYIDTPTQSIDVDGTAFAYRDLGPRSGVPLVLLNHWGAVLDNFDPRIVDGLSRRHRIIAIDYRGIGASGGTAPVTIDATARDAIALIHALGFEKIDLLGFSLGGFVAQDIAESTRAGAPTHPDRHGAGRRQRHRRCRSAFPARNWSATRTPGMGDFPVPRRVRAQGAGLPQ